jgi:transcriptional regulator with XRE-family HTH domain
MNSVSAALARKFQDKAYRDGFVGAQLSDGIAAQIALLRERVGMSQAQLAEAAGMKQSRISVLENPSYEGVNTTTLKRIAAAFDVALIVRFVPFSELLNWAVNFDEDQLAPSSYSRDPAFQRSADAPLDRERPENLQAAESNKPIAVVNAEISASQRPLGSLMKISQTQPSLQHTGALSAR